MAQLNLNCAAFAANEPIPARYTGEGADVSPPLSWNPPPSGTKELALIVDDPDAPTPKPWVHWILFGIPAETRELPEGLSSAKSPAPQTSWPQAKTSWGAVGYRGPMPPKGHGRHRYFFRLYALDISLPRNVGVEKDDLLKVMQGHILAQAELIGTYERK